MGNGLGSLVKSCNKYREGSQVHTHCPIFVNSTEHVYPPHEELKRRHVSENVNTILKELSYVQNIQGAFNNNAGFKWRRLHLLFA
jgi:predicted oxidoreductase